MVDSEGCAVPTCPGSGMVYRVDRGLASVDDWPSDIEGFHRARERLQADPTLAGLPLGEHPDFADWERARRDEERRRGADVRWVSRHREDADRLELSFGGTVGTLAQTPGTYLGATAAADWVFLIDAGDARDNDEEEAMLNFLFGDTLGAGLRAHFLYRADSAQAAEWITAVGVSATLLNRFEQSVLRLPTYLGTVLPEVGAVFRSDRAPTWYIAWDLPFSVLLDHDLALDIVARVFLVDDWIELPDDAPPDAEDTVETILTLGVGFRLP